MASGGLRAFVLCQVEPEADSAAPAELLAALRGAECVVSMNSWLTDAARAYAHVLLPVGAWAETDGTFINVEGTAQSWRAAVPPPGQARPAWKVLRVLAESLGIAGCAPDSARDIAAEAMQAIPGVRWENKGAWRVHAQLPPAVTGLQRVTLVPMNAADALVRRAPALQQTPDRADGALHVNAGTAARTGVQPGGRATLNQDGRELTLPVVIDEGVCDDGILVHGGNAALAALGRWFGPATLRPV
jgi:NADH-quinone oxidoreductase subunit G